MRVVFPFICILSLSFLFRLLFFSEPTVPREVGKTVTLRGVVWDEPRRSQFSQRIEIDDLTISVPEYPQYHFGDTLEIQGIIEENTFTSKKGDEVTELLVTNPEVAVLETPRLLHGIIWMLQRITSTVTGILPSDEAALLLGITIGVKSEFNRELLDVFTSTGILHVVAASGSNVVTLTGVVLFSLNQVVRRRIAISITLFIIGWYTVLAGFDPPIVRAGIMALITLSAQMIGRQNHSLLALGLTVWIMVMVDPRLLGSIGFQLSVSATGGIIIVKPLLDYVLRFPKVLKDDLSTTLAAQIGSLPILLGAFGSFAPLSIILNMLVLWCVPIIMILGLLGSFGAVIHPFIATPFVYGAYPFLVYFLQTVAIASDFIAPLTVPEFSFMLTISYYLISLSIILLLRRKKYE